MIKPFFLPRISPMKTLFLIAALLTTQTSFAKEATLKYSVEFLFEKVLEKKHLTKKDHIAFPKFYYSSKTPVKQFQDAIEGQWGMRPDFITNAYAVANNEVYIMDDAEYYESNKRCMDDSVVHELVHYVQVKYLNWDLNDESLEWDAVGIQTEFREEFCKL